MDFARLLRSVIPDKHFVGRYGGDEFMAVIYHTSKTEIEELLQGLSREKDRWNNNENQIPIDYACGWANGVCSFKNEEFKIVDMLSHEYPVKISAR